MLNKKSLVYLLVTFFITEACWLAVIGLLNGTVLDKSSPLFIIYVLGGFLGPIAGAFAAKGFFGAKGEFKGFLKQIIRVKADIRWYILVLAVPFILMLLPWLVNQLLFGHQELTVKQPFYMIFAFIPFMMIGGGFEELGWRGTFLPELLNKYSLLIATLIVAVFWTVWHLPLWFINGVSQYGSSFAAFAANVLGLSLVLSVVYIKTKSIFLCILLHSLDNAIKEIYATPFNDNTTYILSICIKFLICVLIFVVFAGKKRLKTSEEKEDIL